MVEGPGATRNGRKVQAAVGMMLQKASIKSTSMELTGRRLESAFSVGKEVFLVLGRREIDNDERRQDDDDDSKANSNATKKASDGKAIALRLHFGMNGVLTVRKCTEKSKLAPWRRKDPICSFVFGNQDENLLIVDTVASTCVTVSAVVALSKRTRLTTRDACGSIFDPLAVLEALEQKESKMICDALLDQDIFPGVGNIIKIEGLHAAGIHPRRLVKDLSKEELTEAIDCCRNYALGWLSSGRAPPKKVYNQTLCGYCKTGRVRMVKMGKDLRRVTFWCESCQPLVLKSKTELAVKTKTNPPSAETRPTPVCPQHGPKVILRRVRNNNNNKNRLFRTCSIQGCPYFCWADAHFPACRCPGRKAVLKASKTERTGGKWFLSCSSRACSFFQWATPCQLAPLINELSPLT